MTNQGQQKPGDRIGGYRVERVEHVAELDAAFVALTHEATGARHVHIANRDKENAFSVAFKTVPADSTGVAHILEHTVLCGSRRYPVRDPFFSMLKRSLSTFMNAFTASDWTMYPFATQNRKDFYNLMDVYLDAAFYPRLDRLSFKQEGHRLELEPDGEGGERLVYKGVVFNEMKGAMSSPDQIMGRSLLNALYPDTTYSHNSGGDPAVIPRLTHEALVAFHRRHYHPSNAYFYTYGNLPLADHLARIEDKVLGRFERIDPRTAVPSQARWDAPRQVVYPYPLAPGEDPARRYQACVAWLTADIQDTFEVLVLSVLEQILLGNDAAPLRRALMDAGLGSALSDGSGFDADNRDTCFTAGLKDVGAEDAGAIEALVFETLDRLAAEGIPDDLVESAVHQIEFHRKEVTNHPYPHGLKRLLQFAGSWLHGGDPLRVLRFDADIRQLREDVARGGFFERRLREHFIDNPHRVRLVLAPDPEMAAREAKRETAELARRQASLDAAAQAAIRADAEALQRLQEADEDDSVLPTLALSEIPPDVPRCAASTDFAASPARIYTQPTAGIVYFSAAAGIGDVPAERLSLLPFFLLRRRAHRHPAAGLRRHGAAHRHLHRRPGPVDPGPHPLRCRPRLSAFRGAGRQMPGAQPGNDVRHPGRAAGRGRFFRHLPPAPPAAGVQGDAGGGRGAHRPPAGHAPCGAAVLIHGGLERAVGRGAPTVGRQGAVPRSGRCPARTPGRRSRRSGRPDLCRGQPEDGPGGRDRHHDGGFGLAGRFSRPPDAGPRVLYLPCARSGRPAGPRRLGHQHGGFFRGALFSHRAPGACRQPGPGRDRQDAPLALPASRDPRKGWGLRRVRHLQPRGRDLQLRLVPRSAHRPDPGGLRAGGDLSARRWFR